MDEDDIKLDLHNRAELDRSHAIIATSATAARIAAGPIAINRVEGRGERMVYVKSISRDEVVNVRQSLKIVGMVVAEVDRDLRYRWIENPHPDFKPDSAIGKRDDELAEDASGIMSFKRAVFAAGAPISKTLGFQRSDGLRHYTFFGYPIIERTGEVAAILTVAVPVPVGR